MISFQQFWYYIIIECIWRGILSIHSIFSLFHESSWRQLDDIFSIHSMHSVLSQVQSFMRNTVRKLGVTIDEKYPRGKLLTGFLTASVECVARVYVKVEFHHATAGIARLRACHLCMFNYDIVKSSSEYSNTSIVLQYSYIVPFLFNSTDCRLLQSGCKISNN